VILTTVVSLLAIKRNLQSELHLQFGPKIAVFLQNERKVILNVTVYFVILCKRPGFGSVASLKLMHLQLLVARSRGVLFLSSATVACTYLRDRGKLYLPRMAAGAIFHTKIT
jgi:hypothetical protein